MHRIQPAVALLLAVTAAVKGQSPNSSPVPREHAAYVMPNGSIQIVTCAALSGVVKALNALYTSTHPNTKFSVLEGDNYSAMAALTFDRSAFAPLGSEFTRIGLGDNLKIAAEPVGFRIAHASLTLGAGVPALGIIVNPANPIASLSLTQLTRIFAVGGPSGDIATWGQAGLKGDFSERQVRPIGPFPSDYLDSEDPQVGEFLSTDKMGGLNMNHTYLPMAHYSDIIQRVGEDPAAIGITALNRPLGRVKLVALKNADTGPAVQGTAAEIAAGRYPLDRFVYIYLRVGKGMPLDEFGKDYMRMVLSEAGQRAISTESAGYIPLNAGELAEERAKLDR